MSLSASDSIRETTELVHSLLRFGQPVPQPILVHKHDFENTPRNEAARMMMNGPERRSLLGSMSSLKLDEEKPEEAIIGDEDHNKKDQEADDNSQGAEKAQSKLRKLLQHTKFQVDDEHTLVSWKMSDYAYKIEPYPFPTRARGIFTEKLEGERIGGLEAWRIVLRGYDKFFNVGEVTWTKWDTIPLHSSPPYEITTKSNGCIIFISALEKNKLIVSSKHSIDAPLVDPKKSSEIEEDIGSEKKNSHSKMGEIWLEKHLQRVGKTKQELANILWNKNLTAVAELCDDSFEEHVLPYPSEFTGLHLHGLNLNTSKLFTVPAKVVHEFAKTWGFIPTPYNIFPSLVGIKTYCETVEQAGGVEVTDSKGNTTIVPIEGFVIRGVKKRGAEARVLAFGDAGQRGEEIVLKEPFFWKVKYDEPYLMYRKWRELTRRVLATDDFSSIKPHHQKDLDTKVYLWWVKREIQEDLRRFDEWKIGKGIIKTRERFLKWAGTPEGLEIRDSFERGEFLAMEKSLQNGPFQKTLIIPVAIPGCGKTTLLMALSHLFKWNHVQSDDFLMKKSGPHFITAVRTALTDSTVVVADKNNHIVHLRKDLVALASQLPVPVRVVGLLWDVSEEFITKSELCKICVDRVENRGDKHQTLRAGEGHKEVIWQFIHQFQKFDASLNAADGAFDEVIHIDVRWGLERTLRYVTEDLCSILEIDMPSNDDIFESIDIATAYEPAKKRAITQKALEKQKNKIRARYYGVTVDLDLIELVKEVVSKVDGEKDTLHKLLDEKRVIQNPHVTLVHALELPAAVEKAAQTEGEKNKSKAESIVKPMDPERAKLLFEHYKTVTETDDVDVEIIIGPHMIWDSRVASIQVSSIKGPGLYPSENQPSHLHITLGTTDDMIRPFEGKLIVGSFDAGMEDTELGGKIYQFEVGNVEVKGKIRALD